MKKRTFKKIVSLLLVIFSFAILATGCNEQNKTNIKDNSTPKPEDVEVGVQVMDSGKVQYTSKDSVLSITLPDSQWKVEKELDVLYSFVSDWGDIKITHTIGADAKKIKPAYKEEEVKGKIKENQVKASVVGMMELENKEAIKEEEIEALDNFALENYRCNILQNISFYRYKVTYQGIENQHCQLVLGIHDQTEIYEITATLYKADSTKEKELEAAIDSFLLLKNTTLQDCLSRTKQYTESTTDGSIKVEGFKEVTSENVDGSTQGGEASLYTCISSVNVRDSAGMDSNIIGALTTGDKVKVISHDKGWYEISYEGKSGYVYQDYIGQ